MRNCAPKANYTQPSPKQEFRSSMQRERPAEGDKRHLIASIGLAVMLAVSALLALAAFEAAEGAGAVIAPEPLPEEPAVATEDVPPEQDAARSLEFAAAEPDPPAATRVITVGELERGDTLSSALRRSNVSQDVVHLVATEMSTAFNFRRAQPGHSFRLAQDLEGRVQDFRYRTTPTESIHLALEDGGYVVRREQAEFTPRVSRIAGIVRSSLYGAMRDLGEGPQLANDFTDVFAWDVDFSRTVQSGDEFRVLYERLYYTDDDGNEIYAGPGRILAARYGGTVGEHTAVYFESEEGRGGYFRPDGSSVERQFLLAPLRYSRISSRFSSARRHPILKITRPHHGIDYVARAGSPVWAVADGEVIYRGWAGGFGNLLKVRHVKGYVSYYAHLSRFAAGLRVGDRIQQKQVIGYVGQTGLATGPHVCFRIAQNGRYVNPARLRSPAAKPVPDAARGVFVATRDMLLSELDAGPFVASGEAL
jgi:murein DD-endopeptidase MepM/ murein hydrolase activator NlpD